MLQQLSAVTHNTFGNTNTGVRLPTDKTTQDVRPTTASAPRAHGVPFQGIWDSIVHTETNREQELHVL